MLPFFFISCWQSIAHSLSVPNFISPMVNIFPFLEFDITKISHSTTHPNVDFVRGLHSRAETGKMRDEEDLQFSMGRYGHPSCCCRQQECHSNKSPDVSLIFFSFSESFSLLIVFFLSFIKMQLCGWQSAHCLPVFEQLVCPGPVPDAADFFFCLLVCLSLYS